MAPAPVILDLFCGAGGAAMGYHRAGFEVVGVDIEPQPHYPFEFHQADALAFVNGHGHRYDAIHASPPCQVHTTLIKGTQASYAERHTDLIPETRRALCAVGTPFVIENVPSAPIRRDVMLCGEMFGLGVLRHRWFETNVPMVQPDHPKHRGRVSGMRHGEVFSGPYVAVYGHGGGKGSLSEWQAAMGINWTANRKSIAEAIPPAYTEYVGAQLLLALRQAA